MSARGVDTLGFQEPKTHNSVLAVVHLTGIHLEGGPGEVYKTKTTV